MNVPYVWEHNGQDSLIYAACCPGAFARGGSLEEALSKLDAELRAYLAWRDGAVYEAPISFERIQEHATALAVRDADSEVIFDGERLPLAEGEYRALKALALRSAACFQTLYDSVPDPHAAGLPPRQTFYGPLPVTAAQMYAHTQGVNDYYFGEIQVPAVNGPDIYACRLGGFEALEKRLDFLTRPVYDGSYGEQWSLRKVCRRFLWHDRIHAKALWRMAVRLFGAERVENPFCFTR